jgi:hypothetical protein
MDVDITLDSQPNTANIQAEQFQDLVQLVGSNPAYAQQVPFKVMLQLSAVPHKRQLIDQLTKDSEGNQQAQQQAQQAQMASALAELSAKVRVLQTQADLNEANAQLAISKTHQQAAGTIDTLQGASLAPQQHAADIANTVAQTHQAHAQTLDTIIGGAHQRQMNEQQAALAQQQADQQPPPGSTGE